MRQLCVAWIVFCAVTLHAAAPCAANDAGSVGLVLLIPVVNVSDRTLSVVGNSLKRMLKAQGVAESYTRLWWGTKDGNAAACLKNAQCLDEVARRANARAVFAVSLGSSGGKYDVELRGWVRGQSTDLATLPGLDAKDMVQKIIDVAIGYRL